jgi:hypothetical protein
MAENKVQTYFDVLLMKQTARRYKALSVADAMLQAEWENPGWEATDAVPSEDQGEE